MLYFSFYSKYIFHIKVSLYIMQGLGSLEFRIPFSWNVPGMNSHWSQAGWEKQEAPGEFCMFSPPLHRSGSVFLGVWQFQRVQGIFSSLYMGKVPEHPSTWVDLTAGFRSLTHDYCASSSLYIAHLPQTQTTYQIPFYFLPCSFYLWMCLLFKLLFCLTLEKDVAQS